MFTSKELELLIAGLPDFDIDDLRQNTQLQGYERSSPQITWLYEILESFDKQELAQFLQFVTGSSKIPLEGFSALQGMNGIDLFRVVKVRAKDPMELPKSHTCFNQLDLPAYADKELMRDRLLYAIKETDGIHNA